MLEGGEGDTDKGGGETEGDTDKGGGEGGDNVRSGIDREVYC